MTDPILNVLVVDDDDITAEQVSRCVKAANLACHVVTAEDGQDALDVLRGNTDRKLSRPYLILLDLNMPRMNGFEFLETLRADKQLREDVIFVLTSSSAEVDRSRAYSELIAGYMVKSAIGPQFAKLSRLLGDYSAAVFLPA